MSLEFRLIDIETRSPYRIAAMDHAIHEECEAGHSPPTLVFHNWEKSVSIANGQALDDLNFEACRENGFEVVRLTTGGKAVVHFPDTEFSYSLFVPITGINPRATYELYCGRIAAALQSLGVSSAVVDNNDIFVGEKKIGGNAQHVKKNVAMQQGVILYEQPDARTMLSLMNASLYEVDAEEKLRDVLTGISAHSSAPQEQVRQILTAHMLSGYEYKTGFLTEREQVKIRELESQYKTLEEAQAPQTRGLCWLPAAVYIQRRAIEARA
ncbi:hypothetical protein EXS74_02320 [Candidatus Woesearchaeota archaeon]|nr:hypothetical protein [Candidatus Woesearchaeota archaeon]